MEPVVELATVVTTQVWALYSLDPNPRSFSGLVERNWVEELRHSGLTDYSTLQQLLDVTGLADSEWDPENCLGQFAAYAESAPSRFRNWRIGRKSLHNRAEDMSAAIAKAVDKTTQILQRRIDALWRAGLFQALDQARLRHDAHGLLDAVSELFTGSPPLSLTREQLFDLIAEWTLDKGRPELTAIARLLFDSSSGGAPAVRRPFALEEIISAHATRAIRKERPGSAVAARARAWLAKSEEERLHGLLLDRRELIAICRDLSVPVPFSLVQTSELDEIARSRLARIRGEEWSPEQAETVKADPDAVRRRTGVSTAPETNAHRAFDSCLFGLALSGGGIRSATFGLGLLQGMADRNILPWIDILSTVSGGGYIGSWLIAWIKRRGSMSAVQESLRGAASFPGAGDSCPVRRPVKAPPDPAAPLRLVKRNSDPHSDHVRPVRLLREYARYLAPRDGFFSPDNWTIATTWLRNTSLNLTILLLCFGAALLAPRLLLLAWWSLLPAIPGHPRLAVAMAGLPLLGACLRIAFPNLRSFGPYKRKPGPVARGDDDSNVSLYILSLILLGTFFETAVLWTLANASKSVEPIVDMSVLLLVAIAILGVSSGRWKSARGEGKTLALATLPSVLLGALMIGGLYSTPEIAGMPLLVALPVMTGLGVPAILVVIGCVFTLLIGLFGRDMSDEQREWWSRLGAWIGLGAFGWLAACSLAFFSLLLVHWIPVSGLSKVVTAAGLTWGGITAAGVKLAFSPGSGRNGGTSGLPWFKTALLKIAPVVFAVGALGAVSAGLIRLIEGNTLAAGCLSASVDDWSRVPPCSMAPLAWLPALALLCAALAWRVDINEFSMHHFYKNRLVRAYLGASRERPHRYPNAFTGFDLEDDIRLHRFQYFDPSQPRDMARDNSPSYSGPFPVVNTALNVTKGADLGVQARKAESFVFTPLWSGFDYSRRQASVRASNLAEYGFQQTGTFGDAENGAMLGTAMAISGAAFNSNAGFHTSPALAFLLTVFGVRLGWWAGNPRKRWWSQASPKTGLAQLLSELTASTTTDSRFVLLSDGGHFENMGLYELIRRRCRFIVVSDAEEDEEFKLEGIGGAIRKCRVDFGVVIDLNLDALQPLGDPGVSRFHYSLGTIVYPGESKCGKLVYIKSSVTGDEPVDVIEFRKRHPEFPHTSTANQFFDESHFESYRALGHHAAEEVFGHDMEELPIKPDNHPERACRYVEAMFKKLEDDWAERLKWLKSAQSDGESMKSVE